jgi:raffinose/stachyose/melibiose transport system substrate-binding protein
MKGFGWKRAARGLLCGVLALGLLSGCASATPQGGTGDQSETPTQSSASGGAAQENVSHEPITITAYRDTITDEFMKALHQVYPEINLEIQYYCGYNSSGYARFSLEEDDLPDVYVATQFFGRDIQAQRLVDLSTYDFVNNYSTTMLNAVDVDGGIYLLPIDYTVMGIYYNKTLLEENGWEVPNSLEELEALLPQIKAAGYTPICNAMNLPGYCFNYFFSLGNTVWFGTQEGVQWKEDFRTDKAKAAGNESLLKVAEYYQRWIDDGLITLEHTGNSGYKENGSCAFYLSLGLSSYTYTDENGKEYEYGMMPWLSEDGSNNMLTRNFSRYLGINKHLEEPGNEQKLEDALNLLRFVSTMEGNALLREGEGSSYASPLAGADLEGEQPFQDVADVIQSGHMVQMVYVDWEDLIIPMAEDISQMIAGEITPEQLLEHFDETYQQVVVSQSKDSFGVAEETLSQEDSTRLVAIAEGKAMDADCTLISVNGCHPGEGVNLSGTCGKLYRGNINQEKINVITPFGDTISVLELTGGEIKAIQAAGADINATGNPYEFRLFVKGDGELQDDETYRVAISTNEVPEAYAQQAEVVELSPSDAIAQYIMELGTFTGADVHWD